MYLGLALLLSVTTSEAQGALPTDGYQIDVHHSFVVGSRRVLGLAGAYTAVAEGADGLAWTPTAFANRPRSIVDRTSWTVDFGFNSSLAGAVDMDGDGHLPPAGSRLTAGGLSLGANILTSDMGFGFYLQGVEGWDDDGARKLYLPFLHGPGQDGQATSLQTVTIGAGAGWAMRGGEFVLGFSGEVVTANVGLGRLGVGDGVLSGDGGRVNLGLLYRPPEVPLRIGVSLRTRTQLEVDAADLDGTAANEPPPDGFHVPRRVNVGVAYMFGPASRGWNHRMSDKIGWGEAVRLADSRYILLTFEASHLAAADEQIITAESFLTGEDRLLRREGFISLHLGAESETIRERLRTRLGLYTVQDRTVPDPDREVTTGQGLHLTGGLDVRLIRLVTSNLRLSLQFDLAGDTYRQFGLSIGFWEPSIALKRAVGIPATL